MAAWPFEKLRFHVEFQRAVGINIIDVIDVIAPETEASHVRCANERGEFRRDRQNGHIAIVRQCDFAATLTHRVVAEAFPLVADMLVVVGRSTPDVENRACCEQFLSAARPVDEFARDRVEDETGIARFEEHRVFFLPDFWWQRRHGAFESGRLDGQRQLAEDDFMAGGRPKRLRVQHEFHVEEVFRLRHGDGRQFVRNRDGCLLAGGDGGQGDGAALDGQAVFRDRPQAAEMGKVDEIIVVFDDDFAFLQIARRDTNRSDNLLVFNESGRWRAVGEDKTVRHEIAVVRIFAEVAAVCEEFVAIFVLRTEAVIAPFPDETALHEAVGHEELHVVFQSAWAVAHGMSIFAEDGGLVGMLFGAFLPIFERGIHHAVDIGVLHFRVAFVMDWARGI